MNPSKYLIGMTFLGSALLLSGCRPTAHELADFAVSIPLGVSRAEVRRAMVDAYAKKIPGGENAYALMGDPAVLDSEYIALLKQTVETSRESGTYVRAYPPDLLDKIQPGGFHCMVGYTATQTAAFEFIFDKNMKYIGFFANSGESVGKRK